MLLITGVSGFDILCSALLAYAVVLILAVVRKQSLQSSAMESLRKEQTVALEDINTANCYTVVFFLACNVVNNYLILRIKWFFFSNESDNVALIVSVLLVANSTANPLLYLPVPGVQIVERGRKIHEEKKPFILPLTTYEYNNNMQEIYNTLKIIYTILTKLFTELNV